MKLIIRNIYRKPITPSCHVIELDRETWLTFLNKPESRIGIACEAINKPFMKSYTREIAWVPLSSISPMAKEEIIKAVEECSLDNSSKMEQSVEYVRSLVHISDSSPENT